MAEKIDISALREILNDMVPGDLDVDRVFQKMIQAPYKGKVPFRHLKNMDPDDFKWLTSDVEIIKWFRRYPSKFVVFEGDTNRVCMIGVRIPSAKFCLQYLSATDGSGCTDGECYKFHVCRKFVAGYCKDGPRCGQDHHFQSDHNRSLLTKQGLDKYSEEDLLMIFVNSQLRVCRMYNRSTGFCEHKDRCMQLHVCEEFVRGTCTGGCNLSHSLDDSEHTKRLRRYYALDDKPHQEVLRNLLIVRRRDDDPTVGTSLGAPKADLGKLLQMLCRRDKSQVGSTSKTSDSSSTEAKSSSAAPETQTSKETSLSSPAAAESAAAVSGSDGAVRWQLEVFGSWRTLSDAESAQIEKAYSDPNNDTVSTSIVLSELGDDCHLVIELNNMTASLLLDADSQPYDELKLRRTGGAAQWSWYWQHDDNSWRSYTKAESAEIEAKYQNNEKRFAIGDGLTYKINLTKMTQENRTSGRVRYIRRRPNSATAQL